MNIANKSWSQNDLERLAEENLGSIKLQVLSFNAQNPYLDFDELYSDALLELDTSLRRYDPLNIKGASFKTFLRRRVMYCLQDARRNYFRKHRHCFISLNAEYDENAESLLDKIGDERDVPGSSKQEVYDWISGKVNYLSSRKRDVISTCFGLDGKSKQNESEIAARMGITAAGVSAIKMKALRDLRKKINGEEIRMHF